MGTSTDAYLYYGFDFYDPEEGLQLIEIPRVDEDGEEVEVGEYLYGLNSKVKDLGIQINLHCSSEYPIWYICTENYNAWRGYSKEVTSEMLKVQSDWNDKLKEACKRLNIEYQIPTWNLASYWG